VYFLKRRGFLRSVGGISAAAIAGCLEGDESMTEAPTSSSGETDTRTSDTATDTLTGSPTDTTKTVEQTEPPTEPGTPTETETPTPTEPAYPESGTFNIILEGEEPWPNNFFNGNVDLEIPYTAEQLRDQYHYQQINRIAESDWLPYEGNDNPRPEDATLLKELGQNILDPEWRQQKIKDSRGIDEETTIFWEDKYTGKCFENESTKEGNLKQRVTESNRHGLWSSIERLVFEPPSSNWDWVRTAALSATEKYSADKETYTTDLKTLDGRHGLGLAITNPTYNQSETSQQETWGIETGLDEKQLWRDLTGYPNRDNQIFTETEDNRDGVKAWRRLGFLRKTRKNRDDPWNFNIEFHETDKWEEFVKNPYDQLGMKFIDSACIAAYIEDQAQSYGDLPQFENADIDVHPDQIKYRVA